MAESKKIEGNLVVEGQKIALIASRFNDFFVSKLVEGAKDAFIRHGGNAGDITEIWVPGAYEIPLALNKLLTDSKQKIDGVVTLGCLIRGATPHFDYISAEATKGIASAGMQTNVPVAYGVITVDTIEQAIERAGTKAGNKGAEACLSLIEMMNLYRQL